MLGLIGLLREGTGAYGDGSRRGVIAWTGLAGIYAFSLSGGLTTDGIYVSLILMLAGVVLSAGPAWAVFRREPIFWASAACALYVLVRGGAALVQYPDEPVRILDGVQDSLVIAGPGFLIVGWWLGGDDALVRRCLLVALAGLVAGILVNLEWSELDRYLAGRKATVSLGQNGPGLYTITAILGVFSIGLPRILNLDDRRRKMIWYGLSCTVLVLLGAIFIWNQSRSAWLAAALVVPVVVFVGMRAKRHGSRISGRARRLAMATVLGLMAVIVLVNGHVVANRLGQEQESVSAVVGMNLTQMPESAITHRVLMWQQGLELVARRPVFGWGPGTAEMLQEGAEGFPAYPHFHNLYLHTLVELGIVGFALVGAVVLLLVKAAVRAFRRGILPGDLAIFLGASFGLFLVVNFFQIRHDDPHGMFYVMFLGGVALTYWMHRHRSSGQEAPDGSEGI